MENVNALYRITHFFTMFMNQLFAFVFLSALFVAATVEAGAQQRFRWPEGKQVAVSLSFDDGRNSQVDRGTALLDTYGIKATFYVVPAAVRQRLEGWKKAVASGHEIGNHSLVHPCTGNFPWARQRALEDYSLKQMQRELKAANDSLYQSLGVIPRQFAYPCGQSFVGRGKKTKSYVPLIDKLFATGRNWLSEGPNDPSFCDFSQLTGMEMDGKDFEQIRLLVQQAKNNGQWLVLAGHDMGDSGLQTTRLTMLKNLMEYAKDPANGIWLAPVGEVAAYIREQRK